MGFDSPSWLDSLDMLGCNFTLIAIAGCARTTVHSFKDVAEMVWSQVSHPLTKFILRERLDQINMLTIRWNSIRGKALSFEWPAPIKDWWGNKVR